MGVYMRLEPMDAYGLDTMIRARKEKTYQGFLQEHNLNEYARRNGMIHQFDKECCAQEVLRAGRSSSQSPMTQYNLEYFWFCIWYAKR